MKKSELTFIAIYKFIESCKYYRAQALEHPHHFPCAQKDESFITPGANHWRHCLRLPGGHWSSTDLESKVHESPIFFWVHCGILNHLALLMFWPMSWGPMITAYRQRVRGSSQRWWNTESAAQMFGFVQQWAENGHFIKEHDDLVYVYIYI